MLPFEQYVPPPELLPSEESDDESDDLDEYLDRIVHLATRTKIDVHKTELASRLDPSDLELVIDNETVLLDTGDWSWDLWTQDADIEATLFLAYPTTQSMARKAPVTPIVKGPPPPRPVTPPPTPDAGEPTNGETTNGEAEATPDNTTDAPPAPNPEPDDVFFDAKQDFASSSARPPGRPVDVTPTKRNFNMLRPLFGWLPVDTIKKTFEMTTQLACLPNREILKVHYKAPNPALNIARRNEDVATDTLFSDTPAVDGGETCAQFYCGLKSKATHAYGMKREAQFINTLEDHVTQCGAPNRLISDGANVEDSQRVRDFLRALHIGRWFSEPYKQHQNPAERLIQQVKHA